MKIRTGLVSNSSSSSFIIDRKCYPSVFNLAIEMLNLRNDDWSGDEEDTLDECPDEEELDRLGREKKVLMSTDRDRDTPVAFTTCNYDTYIYPFKDYYLVSTCNNHMFSMMLKGQLASVKKEDMPELCQLLDVKEHEFDREDIEFSLARAAFFWWPVRDLEIREQESSLKIHPDKCKIAKDHSTGLAVDKVFVRNKDGDVTLVCPECFKKKMTQADDYKI